MHHIKTYTITLIPSDKACRAVCLALPGCEVSAPTKEAALELIEDQIKARIADATVRRQPIPVDRTSTKFLWINTEEFLV
jgi:hypothetical protein